LVYDATVCSDWQYWDFAMEAYRYCTARDHAEKIGLAVMIHYLCNLFGVYDVEGPFLCQLGLNRKANTAAGEWASHGWEMDVLARRRKP
jgi:hypothetical protein